MSSLINRFLDHYEAKSWLDRGFRTWPRKAQEGALPRFYLRYDVDDYQGDKRYSLTFFIFGRVYQYTVWRP